MWGKPVAATAAADQLVLLVLLAAGAAGADELVEVLSLLVDVGAEVVEPESVPVDDVVDVELLDFPPRLSVL